jgi:hypothetical protein
MPEEYALDCPPITAHISQGIPGWNIVVRLLNVEKSHRGISDLAAAQSLAIEHARELCRTNRVNEPECLNSPRWIQTETD